MEEKKNLQFEKGYPNVLDTVFSFKEIAVDYKRDVESYAKIGNLSMALAIFSSYCDYRLGRDEQRDAEYIDLFRSLIRLGANLNYDTMGRAHSPLFSEAKKGNLATVKILLECGAKVDGYFWSNNPCKCTPLMMAAKGGYRDVVECLLKSGAKIDKCDLNRERAIDYARANKQYEVEKLLAMSSK